MLAETRCLRVAPRTLRSGRPGRSRGASGRGAVRRGEPARGRRGAHVAGAPAHQDAWQEPTPPRAQSWPHVWSGDRGHAPPERALRDVTANAVSAAVTPITTA